jgi:hypothetical protein
VRVVQKPAVKDRNQRFNASMLDCTAGATRVFRHHGVHLPAPCDD